MHRGPLLYCTMSSACCVIVHRHPDLQSASPFFKVKISPFFEKLCKNFANAICVSLAVCSLCKFSVLSSSNHHHHHADQQVFNSFWCLHLFSPFFSFLFSFIHEKFSEQRLTHDTCLSYSVWHSERLVRYGSCL